MPDQTQPASKKPESRPFTSPFGTIYLGLDQEYIDQHPFHLIPGGHDFQFERRPITGGWDTGMWCSKCDSRMNQAPEVCPGRKGA